MKKLFALSVTALLLAQFPALPSQAETCERDFCEVTFSLTGEITQWQVPAGVTQLSFEIAGASGGRGGLGGKVTGTLTDLPETLFIAVGGGGSVGSQAPGGFNGGGNAGGFRANEGSGGGASDIRFGLGLADRVVVAGGGAGAGGFSGGFGGSGGGLIGGNGQSGQGSGGLGGSQSSGGSGGNSNGGTQPTAGGFGFGGTGGNSQNAGGGGGGGGWFGGGGGGADDDSCCTDGGGGGGGSSFALASSTLNVQHLHGVQTGNGFVKLSYQKEQSLIGFEALQESQTAIFTLGLLLPQVLELEHFDLSQLRCEFIELQNEGSTIRVIGTSCEDGEQLLKLKSGSLTQGLPSQDLAVLLNFDALGPQFFWSEARVNHFQGTIVVDYTVTEAELTAEAIDVQGCQTLNVGQNSFSLSDCATQEVVFAISAGALSDHFGNTGPLVRMSQQVMFDRVLPEASFLNPVSDLVLGTHQVELVLSETAAFDTSRIQMVSSGNCSFQTAQTPLGYLLSSACGYGSFSYIVPVGSLVDSAGNVGPSQQVRFDFVLTEPDPLVVPLEPAPEVVSAPAEPEPAVPIQQPETPGPVAVVEPVLVLEPEPAVTAPVEPAPTSGLADLEDPGAMEGAAGASIEVGEPLEPVVTLEIEREVEPRTDLSVPEDEISQPKIVTVAGPLELKPETTPWFLAPWSMALIGIALVLAAVLLRKRISGK